MLSDMLQQPKSQLVEERKRITGKQNCEQEKKRKVSQPESILQGCSLKDVIEWHSSGKLSNEEFDKVKGRLLESM